MPASDAALTRRLMPLFLVFVLDAVGLGVALPVLPFYVMGLQATALQLAVVVSSNFIAQTFGKKPAATASYSGIAQLWLGPLVLNVYNRRLFR